MRRLIPLLTLTLTLVFISCASDDGDGTSGADTFGPDMAGGPDVMGPDTQGDPDVMGDDTTPDPDVIESPTRFRVRVANIAGDSGFPTPFAPGVWAIHDGATVFTPDDPDPGMGLEALAEDGDPSVLAASLAANDAVAASGVFNTPVGADEPGPLLPGAAYEFEIEAMPGDGDLFLATMVVFSNDVFAAPAMSIPLFDEDGEPIPHEDASDLLMLWDAGTEVSEAPGPGAWQPIHQPGPNTGPSESVIHRFQHPTRALPLPRALVNVDVSPGSGGALDFTVTNISGDSDIATTPIAPVFFATHTDEWAFFSPGEAASAALQTLAEDGSPADLVALHDGAVGTGTVGAAAEPTDAPGSPGPIAPGQSYAFSITPDAAHPRLSFAAMVVQSNDVFLAPGPGGVALFDDEGTARPAAAIAADIERALAIWDAGTEQNEVPGAGPNQPLRQAAANTGPDDPDTAVRIYNDPTNDLMGEGAGGFVSVEIAAGEAAGSYEITFHNTSDTTAFHGLLTPVLWALHSDELAPFEEGAAASAALESLAEDGDPSALSSALSDAGAMTGVAAQPDGAMEDGPLHPGDAYTFTVTPDATHDRLSIVSMVVPSNDTFVAFDPAGIPLLDADGEPRSATAIQSDIDASLSAWDAGTEANQAGAIGPSQAPHQEAAGAGAPEGDGTVRATSGSLWPYPTASEILHLSITPLD